MLSFFNLILFQPLYNALVFLSDILPGHDIGFAIIVLTLGVKFLLMPLYHKSLTTQSKLKQLDPKIKKIKEEYATDNSEQAKQIMELYKEHGVNPFASFLVLFIQLPVIIALLAVFKKGFNFDPHLLYSFVSAPAVVHTLFLGSIDLTAKSWLLAIITGITQFVQMRLAIPPLPQATDDKKGGFSQDFARSMNMQMRYVMPILIIFIARGFPAAISIYWITGNLFAIAHELLVKRRVTTLLAH